MVLPLIIAAFSTIIFASLSLILFVRHKKASSKIAMQEALEKQKVYELSILKQVQDKIGYSLDVEYIVDVIIGSLQHLFTYSTASSMVIKNNKINLKTHVEQYVGPDFVEQVKKSMLLSLSSLVPSVPIQIEEQIVGATFLDQNNKSTVASFFNIPLEVGNQTVGIIDVSSVSKDLYSETQTTMLRQIVSQASSALTKLGDVLVTEKGKLTSMVGSLADGVFMVDTNNNLLIINESAKNFLHLASNNPLFTEIISSIGTQYNIVEKINQASQTNNQIIDNEININDKIFKMFITPVLDLTGLNNNKPIGASILMHDITIEKNITKIKEDFTHMIVHELRAPLTAIKDSSELILEEFDGTSAMDKEQQDKLLKIIDKQSKNLLEQINQILDAAKIESGKFTINKTPSDIAQVIQDTIESFLPQAQKRQILISSDITSSLPQVEIDPIRINQVLNNLLSNSLKFTPPGGRIIASAKTEGDYIIVSIKDTGMGIPENEQGDLFSKYYQIKTTPHQLAKKGTGLGLFITKGIVEAHGGSVGIISREKEGTTIYFKLPLKDVTPASAQVITEHFPQTGINPVSNMVN
jgi:signal transduction histidine kinase